MFSAYILYKWGTTETTRMVQAQANIIMMNMSCTQGKARAVWTGLFRLRDSPCCAQNSIKC